MFVGDVFNGVLSYEMMMIFFFLVRGCVLIILYYNITLLHSAILHTHTHTGMHIFL